MSSIRIDGEKLRAAIKVTGLTLQSCSQKVGRGPSYFSNCIHRGTMEEVTARILELDLGVPRGLYELPPDDPAPAELPEQLPMTSAGDLTALVAKVEKGQRRLAGGGVMVNTFRLLKASEIDCRVGSVYARGFTLLLYKDARVDFTILDETVGRGNWASEHSKIPGDTLDRLFCTVYINPYPDAGPDNWIPPRDWPYQQDAGVVSRTEGEKGQASDALKRACVRWGIGRELYTAPFIFIDAETVPRQNGRGYDLKNPADGRGYYVNEIEYNDERKITYISISKRGEVVFSHGTPKTAENAQNGRITPEDARRIESAALTRGKAVEDIMRAYKVAALTDLTMKQYANIMRRLTGDE